MSLHKNEVAINKAASVQLDNETIAIVAFMYHSRDKGDPADKSFYRTEVRVEKVEKLMAEVKEMKEADLRLKPWRWPNKTWPAEWFLGYDKSSDNLKGAKWLASKVRKAMSWERFEELVRDGVKTLGTGEKKKYPGAQYEFEGFEDEEGNVGLCILDKAVLKAHCGKVMWKKAVLKRDLRASKTAA